MAKREQTFQRAAQKRKAEQKAKAANKKAKQAKPPKSTANSGRAKRRQAS